MDVGALRTFLKQALPLTPNGKVDRKALPAPEMQRTGFGGAYEAPEGGIEQALAALWAHEESSATGGNRRESLRRLAQHRRGRLGA